MIAIKIFDYSCPCVSSATLDVAQRAFDESVKFAYERQTMEKPLWKHHTIGYMIANVAMQIESTCLLVWKAAWSIDTGERNTTAAAFAKAYAADMAMKVCTNAMQVFGGYEYMSKYPVELMRDVKSYQVFEGTNQIQRRIIAREIFLKIYKIIPKMDE